MEQRRHTSVFQLPRVSSYCLRRAGFAKLSHCFRGRRGGLRFAARRSHERVDADIRPNARDNASDSVSNSARVVSADFSERREEHWRQGGTIVGFQCLWAAWRCGRRCSRGGCSTDRCSGGCDCGCIAQAARSSSSRGQRTRCRKERHRARPLVFFFVGSKAKPVTLRPPASASLVQARPASPRCATTTRLSKRREAPCTPRTRERQCEFSGEERSSRRSWLDLKLSVSRGLRRQEAKEKKNDWPTFSWHSVGAKTRLRSRAPARPPERFERRAPS